MTPEHTAELIARYQAGETLHQLGTAFKINHKTVGAILNRGGIPTRRRKLTDADITNAIQLYESGLSLQAVGDRLSVEPGTILNHFKQRGVARRPVGTNQWK